MFLDTVSFDHIIQTVVVHYSYSNRPWTRFPAICEAPVKPLFCKSYEKESWARCSLLILIPGGLSGYSKALSVASPEDHTEIPQISPKRCWATSVFYSRAQHDLVSKIQVWSLHHGNPSLILLSYTVSSERLETKLLQGVLLSWPSLFLWVKKEATGLQYSYLNLKKKMKCRPTNEFWHVLPSLHEYVYCFT